MSDQFNASGAIMGLGQMAYMNQRAYDERIAEQHKIAAEYAAKEAAREDRALRLQCLQTALSFARGPDPIKDAQSYFEFCVGMRPKIEAVK